MYLPGQILYFDPFYFKNGQSAPKPKYFIVIDNDGDNTVLACLPTRGDFVPSTINILHGCINDDSINFNCYHFEAEKVVCTNGWCFDLPTFVYGSQLDDYKLDLLQEIYQVEGIEYQKVGKLMQDEFEKLINCFYNSGSVKRKLKPTLKKHL